MKTNLTALLANRCVLIPRLALAAILGLAAYGKLTDLDELVATVQRSSLVPPNWEHAIALLLVGFEILLTCSLLFGRLARLSLSTYAGLSSLFFGYALWRWYQDIHAPCSCFGVLFRLEPWQSLPLTVFMTVLALVGIRLLDHSSSGAPAHLSLLFTGDL